MSLRKILTQGDPTLEKTCRPVEKFDQKLHWLLDDLKETLENAGGNWHTGLDGKAPCPHLFWQNQDMVSAAGSPAAGAYRRSQSGGMGRKQWHPAPKQREHGDLL